MIVIDLASILSDFFFFIIIFFFLATWLLESRISPGEVEEDDEEIGEEAERSTLESTWCCSGGGDGRIEIGAFETTEVEKNHTRKPTVNPGRENVAIEGSPTFPKVEKGPRFPSERIPWLENFGKVTIRNNGIITLWKLTLTRNISWIVNFKILKPKFIVSYFKSQETDKR